MSRLRMIPLFAILATLGGCNFVLMAPAGDIAMQQRDLVIISTILMLLIIIPVMALTVIFAWRYRSSNTAAPYNPEWDHSTQLELVIWAAPLLIVICLGAVTWMATHLLDPYRQIGRISPTQAMPYSPEPLEVDVVALDWKWLFIYPKLGIATVNDVAAPINQPINFRITSTSVMNSFYIPALAGQIYAMPAMETKLHAVINETGDFRGISANYSGAGFSGMHFQFHGRTQQDFDAWVAKAKADGGTLDRASYLELEHPSQNVPPRTFATVAPQLFDAILNMCVEPGKMCLHEMMSIDQKGGLGLAGITNTLPLEYDKYARRGAVFAGGRSYVASLCTPADPLGTGIAHGTNAAGPATPTALSSTLPHADAGSTTTIPPRKADTTLLSPGPIKGLNLPRLSDVPSLQPLTSLTAAPRWPFHS